ncbi:MAG: hypothetical protein AB1798_20810 [Spirochaetota bacterium]
MKNAICYKSNLTFLSENIKMLKNGLTMNLATEYFLDKVIEDLFFIDSALRQMLQVLKDNVYLSDRAEYLESLQQTEHLFIELLKNITDMQLPFSEYLEALFPKLRAFCSQHRENVVEIRSLTPSGADPKYTPAENEVVSPEEFRFLLMKEEPEP